MLAIPLAIVLAAAQPFAPALEALADTLRADETQQWSLLLKLVNRSHAGFFTDSLVLELEPTAGAGRGPGPSRTALDGLARIIQPLSVGDSTIFQFSGRALIERGEGRIVLHGHSGSTFHRLETRFPIGGGALYDAYPSALIETAGGRVECLHVRAKVGDAPTPGVVLVPGDEVGARGAVLLADELASLGLSVAVVSLPGRGTTEGARDMAGPRSLEAVLAVLSMLRAQAHVDSTRVGLWGVGEGATAALLCASAGAPAAAVVCEGADYEFEATLAAATPADRARILAAIGTGPEARNSRTVLGRDIRVPLLLVQGGAGSRAPVEPARVFELSLRERGRPVESLFAPPGRALSVREVQRTARTFLQRRLLSN